MSIERLEFEATRREVCRCIGLLGVSGGTLTTSVEDVAAASATMTNEHIKVIVNDNGTFQLQTANGQQLTYPESDTSGLTVQVDNTNYVIGAPEGTSMGEHQVQGTQFTEETTVATTEWQLPEGIRVIQRISLAGEAARFRLSVENIGDSGRRIRIRYLHDYQVGPQDGAPIFVNGDVLTNEKQFESPTFSSWQTYDQLPNPSLTGAGTVSTTPTKVEFVAWEDAEESGYEYDGFDPAKEFYTPGETNSPESDSAGLLYYDLGTVTPGETEAIVTSYGVGPPAAADVDGLDQALIDYRNAVTSYLDTVIEAKAEGYAAQYLREETDGYYEIQQRDDRSWAFRTSIVRVFKLRAGEASREEIDPGYFDDIRALEQTLPDEITTSQYDNLYRFTHEMFEAVPSGDPDAVEDDARRSFRESLLGEGEDQEEPLTLGGQTLAEIQDQFSVEFDTRRQQFVEACRQEDIDREAIGTLVSRVNAQADRIEAEANQWAESYRGVTAAALEGEQMFTKAEAATIGSGVGTVTGIAIGAGIGLLAAGPTGEEPILMGIGKEVGGFIGSGAGLVVGLVAAEIQESGNQWSREFAGTETWKAITSFELQWLYYLKRAPERVLPSALANYASGEAANRTATVPGTLFDAGCADAPALVNLDIEIEGIEVPTITEGNRLGDSQLAEGEGTITVRNPRSNDRAITPTFLRDKCTISAQSTAEEVEGAWMTIPPRSELPEISPGETADLGFVAVTPLDSDADYTVSFLLRASALSETTRHTSAVISHSVGTSEAVTTNQLSSGLLMQGDSESVSASANGASQSSFSLTYGGSDLDLHVYDDDGNHVGRNYETGQYETEIPTASSSGPDEGTGYESVQVSESSGTYQAEVIAVSTPASGSGFTLTNSKSASLPPSMDVRQSDIDISAEPGETAETSLTVRETAGDQALSDVNIEAVSLSRNGDGDIIEDISVSPTPVTVSPGDQERIELAVSTLTRATPGEHTGAVTVATEQQSVNLPLTVFIRGERPESGIDDGIALSPETLAGFGIGSIAVIYLASRMLADNDDDDQLQKPPNR